VAGPAREVIFEMTRMGRIVRVTAVDAKTGAEAVIQGPATSSQKELQRVALAKLNYVLNKQKA
jgi:hypothetical protein